MWGIGHLIGVTLALFREDEHVSALELAIVWGIRHLLGVRLALSREDEHLPWG